MKYTIELNEDMNKVAKIIARENDMTVEELIPIMVIAYAKNLVETEKPTEN